MISLELLCLIGNFFSLPTGYVITNVIGCACLIAPASLSLKTRTGTPFLQSNFLRSSLYPILKELGIEKQGFHGFRRFRVTHLESSYVPPALVKYWTGHAKSSDGEVVRQTVTDKYIKMAKDTKFRAEVAERIGIGFELPKAGTVEVVPSVPNSQEMEVVVSV